MTVDRSRSITRQTGRKLDFIIIGVMAVAIAYFLVDKFVWVGEEPATGDDGIGHRDLNDVASFQLSPD